MALMFILLDTCLAPNVTEAKLGAYISGYFLLFIYQANIDMSKCGYSLDLSILIGNCMSLKFWKSKQN